jgi:2-keto-4-pentenoate hydratase/2-oxohepta-3-ene-1,7-dioic acid hydratase in catechol pathway
VDGTSFDSTAQHTRKLIGVGLNYRSHADDLAAPYPDEPVFFLKGAHTLARSGGTILLPRGSRRVTAEAELGLLIGYPCQDVQPEYALEFVAGVVAVLDQTAEDILERNPRFLTRSKNFETFLVVQTAVTPIHVAQELGGHDLSALMVRTVRNGKVVREAPVADMTFSPARLVADLSTVMPLNPGDLICTGTPGAAVLTRGDKLEAEIVGLGSARAVVRAPGPRPARW